MAAPSPSEIKNIPEPDINLDALREELITITRSKHQYWFWKRTFDIIFSAGFLLVFSPSISAAGADHLPGRSPRQPLLHPNACWTQRSGV